MGTDNIEPERHKGKPVRQKVQQHQIDALAKDIGAYKYLQVSVFGALETLFAESVRAALSKYKTSNGGTDERCLVS